MSARSTIVAAGKMSVTQRLKMLKEQFPEISEDIVEDIFQSSENLEDAVNFLRDLDLEIWASKNRDPVSSDLQSEFPPLSAGDSSAQSCSSGAISDASFQPPTSFARNLPVPREANANNTDWNANEPFDENFGHFDPDAEEFYPSNWGNYTQSEPMKMQLDKDLAAALIMTFGLMQVPINVNDKKHLELELDMHTAHKIYQAWRSTQELRDVRTNGSTDEGLAQVMQEIENEDFAKSNLSNMTLKEIMDETYALSLLENESESSGTDINSLLQYQASNQLESKWADVLLKTHNYVDGSSLSKVPSGPKTVYARSKADSPAGSRPASSKTASGDAADDEFPLLNRTSSETAATKILKVVPVNDPAASRVAEEIRKNQPVDYYGARSEALELKLKAMQFGVKAGEAFTNKKLGGAVAYHYLQKSHEHKKLSKEKHLEAAADILLTRNPNMSSGEIDLHGLRMDEVAPALDYFFSLRQPKEVKIIAGRGVHSKKGSSEVRRMVGVYLKKYGYEYQEGPPEGVFYVDLPKKPHARPP